MSDNDRQEEQERPWSKAGVIFLTDSVSEGFSRIAVVAVLL